MQRATMEPVHMSASLHTHQFDRRNRLEMAAEMCLAKSLPNPAVRMRYYAL